MAITDILSNVITSYKADTSDMKAGLKDLQGEEKKLAQAQLDAANARNEQLETWKKQLDSLGPQLEMVRKLFEFSWDAMKAKQAELRKEIAAGGVDVDRLSAAFGGLKTHMEVLEFAARNNQSAFRLTQTELETVAAATRTLTERGFDAAEVQDRLTNALVTGKSKGLEQYGIVMHGLGDTMTLAGDQMGTFSKKAANVSEIMQQLKPIAAEAGKGLGQYGEEADRAAVTFHDAWERLKMSFSQLGDQLGTIVDSLGRAVVLVAKLSEASKNTPVGGGFISNLTDLSDATGFDFMGAATGGASYFGGKTSERAKKWLADHKQAAESEGRDFEIQLDRAWNEFVDAGMLMAKGEKYLADKMAEVGEKALEEQKKAAEKAAELWKEQHAKILAMIAGTVKSDGDAIIAALEQERQNRLLGHPEDNAMLDLPENRGTYAGPSAISGNYGVDRSSVMGLFDVGVGKYAYRPKDSLGHYWAQGADLPAPDIAADQAAGGRQYSGDAAWAGTQQFSKNMEPIWAKEYYASKEKGLEKIFGPVGDFDLYKKAFEGITQAIGSSFGAWIDGSESASKAFKKFIGESVKAVAVQAAVESLKEGAYALGDLAFGNAEGAALHGLAAAKFAAVAIAAGVAAHELGTGGGTSSANASGAGGGVPSGVSGGAVHNAKDNNGGPIIVYGDSFADDSPYNRALRAKKLVKIAEQAGSGSYGGGY